jgi:hypothetical protein
MSSAHDEVLTLRADVKRLTELVKIRDQLLESKDAHLVSKDRVIADKSSSDRTSQRGVAAVQKLIARQLYDSTGRARRKR